MRAALVSLAGVVVASSAAEALAQTSLASVPNAGGLANSASYTSQLSADGNLVVFDSRASNLVAFDNNFSRDVFVRDRAAGTTVRASVNSLGQQILFDSFTPDLSDDGAFVVWDSAGAFEFIDGNGHNDVYLRDMAAKKTKRVSVDTAGGDPDDDSYEPRISADGRFVAFWSEASDLVASDTNARNDIFVRDLVNGVTERVNLDAAGNQATLGHSYNCAISGDGRFVAFGSDAKLVPADTNTVRDVYVRDRLLATTVRVSVGTGGVQGNGIADRPSLSDDGRYVAFQYSSNSFDPNDLNGTYDIYVHDRQNGTTWRASTDSNGLGGDDESFFPMLSGDGRFVTFESESTDLVEGDLNGVDDVFVHDNATGATYRESVSTAYDEANNGCQRPALDEDGSVVCFQSSADNLVAGDTNRNEDIFARDRAFATASWSNYGSGWSGTLGVPALTVDVPPVLNATFTLTFGSSSAVSAPAVLLVGEGRASIPLKWGAVLLVDPLVTLAVTVDAAGLDLPVFVDPDPALAGIVLDVQGLLLDPGAIHGLAFTRGLELALGF